MRRSVRSAPIVAALLAVLLPALAGGAAFENQDVVRMVVAGRSSREIVEAIRAHEPSFDLTPEMLSELRIAGVPDVVVEAMRERQAAVTPPPSPSPSPGPAEEEASIHVRWEPLPSHPDRPLAIWFPDRMEDDLARALHLGPSPTDRKVTDLAVFVACLTAEHVPDQWRVRSVLGQDFVSMPRHQLLVLHSGARGVDPKEVPREVRALFPRPRKDEPPPGVLRLDLPPQLVAPVDPKEKHRILVGVAVRVEDGYRLLASVEKADVEVVRGREIRVRVLEGKQGQPFSVELVEAASGSR